MMAEHPPSHASLRKSCICGAQVLCTPNVHSIGRLIPRPAQVVFELNNNGCLRPGIVNNVPDTGEMPPARSRKVAIQWNLSPTNLVGVIELQRNKQRVRRRDPKPHRFLTATSARSR